MLAVRATPMAAFFQSDGSERDSVWKPGPVHFFTFTTSAAVAFMQNFFFVSRHFSVPSENLDSSFARDWA